MVPASFIFMANKLGTGMLERLRRAFSDITNDDRTDVLQSGVGTAPSYTDNVYKAVIPNFLYKPPFGYPMFKDIPEIKRMAKVPHVIMVTNTICNEIAGLDWDIYKHEDYEDVVPDEIVKKTKDWFLNPNRNDESFEMIMRTLVRDILEMDAGVVVKVRNLKDEFLEMYVRDGGTFTKNPDIYGIMPDERAYYQYGWLTGARPQEFNRNEIAYFMLNPRSDSIYGMSNVEVLMNTLQLLTYGIDANLEYFTDNNIPKGVLKMINANADDIKAFKQAWSEQMKTKDQAGKWRKQFHKMPIINTDGSFERIAFSNVELEFIQQQEWFVKLVWACYGVTPSELGFTDDSNRATDMVQSSVFKRKLIRPLTQLLEYNFNRNIVNDLPWIKGKYENMVLFEFNKVDTQEDLNRRQIIWGDIEKGFRTVNECREDEELEPIEGGDELRNKISGSFEGFNPFNSGKKEDDGESVRREFDGEEDVVDFGLKSFELKHKYIKRTGSPGNYVYHYADGSTSKKPKESDGGPALVSPISKKLDKLNEKRQNILKKISAADKKYAAAKKKDDAYAGELSGDKYEAIQDELASVSADLDDLGSELDSVEGQISDIQDSVKAEKAVKKELDDLVKNIDEFTRGDLQGVVEALADKYDGDSDKMLKYVDNKVKENDIKKESGGKEASGSKVEDTKIEDLRNIAEDSTTSDLQGVTMALANDLIGASFSDLSGSKDLRAIANDADNVLLEFANGEIELDEVKESIAGLRKEYSVAKNKTGKTFTSKQKEYLSSHFREGYKPSAEELSDMFKKLDKQGRIKENFYMDKFDIVPDKSKKKSLELDSKSVLFSEGKDFEKIPDLESELKKDLNDVEKKILSVLKEFGQPLVVNEVKGGLNDLVKRVTDLFSLDLNKFAVVVKATIRKNFEIGLEKAEVETNKNFVPDMEAIDFLESYTFDNIKDMSEDVKGKLRGELERGIMAGEGVSKLSKRVKDVLDVGKVRAEAISRTESLRAKNMGELSGWKQTGLPVEKMWDAHLDARTSEQCKHLNGKWVDVNSTFSWKGEAFQAPPGHVNCRSSLSFRLKEKHKK